jgi:hypothetical protein
MHHCFLYKDHFHDGEWRPSMFKRSKVNHSVDSTPPTDIEVRAIQQTLQTLEGKFMNLKKLNVSYDWITGVECISDSKRGFKVKDDIKVEWGNMLPVAHVNKIVDVKIRKRYTTHHYLLLFPLWYNPVKVKGNKSLEQPPLYKKYKKNTNENVRCI